MLSAVRHPKSANSICLIYDYTSEHEYRTICNNKYHWLVLLPLCLHYQPIVIWSVLVRSSNIYWILWHFYRKFNGFGVVAPYGWVPAAQYSVRWWWWWWLSWTLRKRNFLVIDVTISRWLWYESPALVLYKVHQYHHLDINRNLIVY